MYYENIKEMDKKIPVLNFSSYKIIEQSCFVLSAAFYEQNCISS